MDILVGSANRYKLEAVSSALGEVFGDEVELDIRSKNVTSQIDAQPVGHEQTIQGALNRLAELRQLVAGFHYDLLVAFENGIYSVQIDDTPNWFDLAWVAVADAEGKQVLAHSAGIALEIGDVEKAARYGYKFNTVGKAIAERTGADKSDPHSFLTNGVVGRTELLRGALKVAVGQLLHRTWGTGEPTK